MPASDRERSAGAAPRKAGGQTRSQLFSVTDLRAEHPASAVAGTASSPPPPAMLHDFKAITCASPVFVLTTLPDCLPQPGWSFRVASHVLTQKPSNCDSTPLRDRRTVSHSEQI